MFQRWDQRYDWRVINPEVTTGTTSMVMICVGKRDRTENLSESSQNVTYLRHRGN